MHAAKVGLALAAVLTVSGWAACVGVTEAQETPQQATTEQKESAQQEATREAPAPAPPVVTTEQKVSGQTEETLRVRQSAVKTLDEALNLELQHQQVGTHSIGVTVVPADLTLRAQLGLPPEQGLVVINVDLNSPAWEAGVAQHDVLLRLGDKPLTSPDDLRKQVDAVGEKPVGLEAIRQGKLVKLRLTPRPTLRFNVTSVKLQDAELSLRVKSRFWIGVELVGAGDALRAQLKLPEGQGVAVNNVYELGPAAKAGIKKHDVLLLLGDKPIPSAEAFRENLQEVGEKPVAIKLVREGKTISIEVTPQKHQDSSSQTAASDLSNSVQWEPLTVDVLQPAAITGQIDLKDLKHVWVRTTPAQPPRGLVTPVDPQSRLQELIKEVKELQKKLESLSEDLQKQQPSVPSR